MNKKEYCNWSIGIMLAVLASLVLTQFVTAQSYPTGTDIWIDDQNLYGYAVQQQEDGSLKVQVEVDFTRLPEYSKLAQFWMEATVPNTDLAIPTTVTFAHPLSWDEVRALCSEAGLLVERYTFVVVSDDGQKAMLGAVADKTGSIDIKELEQIAASNNVAIKGIMVVVGNIKSENLPQLGQDTRVFLVDTVAAQVTTQLKNSDKFQDVSSIDIFVPSPYWDLVE